MVITKYISIFFLFFFLTNSAQSFTDSENKGAQSTGREDLSHMNVTNNNFKKGLAAMKQAMKYKKKEKVQKAKKRFNDCIKFFLAANEEKPNQSQILFYLGFSYKNVGDKMMAEIYYEQGLEIDPEHININKYLGELYIETNRINNAKERLIVLKSCNCKEYEELNFLVSKY